MSRTMSDHEHEQMGEFQALFAGFITGSAVKFMTPVTVELIDDEEGNHTGYFYVTHTETGERLIVRTDPVPRCPACETYAVWNADHWETAHKLDCAWMLDPTSECYG